LRDNNIIFIRYIQYSITVTVVYTVKRINWYCKRENFIAGKWRISCARTILREKLLCARAVDHGLNFNVVTRVAEFLARFLMAKRTFLVLDHEWCRGSFWSAGWTGELDTRLEKGIPEAAKELDHFVYIYLYNTYEACIQSP